MKQRDHGGTHHLRDCAFSRHKPNRRSDSGYTAAVRSRWNAISWNICRLGAGDAGRRIRVLPTPEVRSFGELLGHLANEHYIFCSQMKGEKNPHEARRLREEDGEGGVREGHQRLDRLLRRAPIQR